MPGRARVVLEGLAPFVGAGLAFGLLYNTLFYPRTLVEYAEAGTIGVLLGAMLGLAEQPAELRRWLQRLSFPKALLVRTGAYSLITALVLALVLSVEPAAQGACSYGDCFLGYVRGPLFLRDLVFSTAFAFGATFVAQVVLLLGTRDFGRLVTGRYRRPRELRAEFMFVDMRNSTAIAETLGNERYSAFLRDFFGDVSDAIGRAGGEIYQYIGDEVVIVWSGGRAAGRWLDCFVAMRGAVDAHRSRYLERYAVAPEFKAGVHAGPAVLAEIGTLKRAHVYHGDVLNTASRIQDKCNETGFDLLASGDALASLDGAHRARFERLAPMALRGKSVTVEMFGLTEARRAAPGTPVGSLAAPDRS